MQCYKEWVVLGWEPVRRACLRQLSSWVCRHAHAHLTCIGVGEAASSSAAGSSGSNTSGSISKSQLQLQLSADGVPAEYDPDSLRGNIANGGSVLIWTKQVTRLKPYMSFLIAVSWHKLCYCTSKTIHLGRLCTALVMSCCLHFTKRSHSSHSSHHLLSLLHYCVGVPVRCVLVLYHRYHCWSLYRVQAVKQMRLPPPQAAAAAAAAITCCKQF